MRAWEQSPFHKRSTKARLENKTKWKTCPIKKTCSSKTSHLYMSRKLWTSSISSFPSHLHSSFSHSDIHWTARRRLHRQTGSNGLHHHFLKRWRKHLKSCPEEVVVVVVVISLKHLDRTEWEGNTNTPTHNIICWFEISSRISLKHYKYIHVHIHTSTSGSFVIYDRKIKTQTALDWKIDIQ